MNQSIVKLREDITSHPLYADLNSLDALRVFMKFHVFAVWDFMSLLKSLQRKITCVEIPWKESPFDPELVRLINEIVLGEESDKDHEGKSASHFTLYLKAMEEIGADTKAIQTFLKGLNFSILPETLKECVLFHLNLAESGKVHEVASSFFYGREKLIPDMFSSILKILNENQLKCPTLIYYFKRHIELDGEEHGPKAMKCLDVLADSPEKLQEVEKAAIESLKIRKKLWDFIKDEINSQSRQS
ncbi:MAG: hypothetical protein COW00_02790 [Bdellovibrio sp. CG12_big_fil_rev_8_21_14_0_65_39_13]|nr:MAG: hypothetical protein COW78_19635 [Bdellovibrio sp. CG22_combo_CG10-13_8_21_14_all_39_27]PIQ61823.1 MAG: hypothetical protein COW00_02790 [Bdellovibrio sp. CG12_big_fil_rev_8_21_14_0_65_39_13]PIR35175.1 MAG: hypothetical protein COV37_09980 [Bdellovibrio sp. CG11_big_fil_rev_8_21_14_0_20_39_38]